MKIFLAFQESYNPIVKYAVQLMKLFSNKLNTSDLKKNLLLRISWWNSTNLQLMKMNLKL